VTSDDLKEYFPYLSFIKDNWPVGRGGNPTYHSYGLLIDPKYFIHTRHELQPTKQIWIADKGNTGNFDADVKLEQDGYDYLLHPEWLKKGEDTVFMRVNGEAICEKLQKKADIDAIVDTRVRNHTRSIKIIRNYYNPIFWEAVKNSNSGDPGWGLYTKAQEVWYCTPTDFSYCKRYAINFRVIVFKPQDVVDMLQEGRKE